MAGPILRLKGLITHMGLSRSAIYDRMDKNSPRYAEDFPKSFPLGGKAVGWYKDEIDAWLASCAINGKSETPSNKTITAPSSKILATQAPLKLAQPFISPPKRPTSQSPQKRTSRPGNLANAIVEGGIINDRLIDYLQMKTWTPAMGSLLIAGIDPPLNCNVIPADGIGLDGKPLESNDTRFYEARRIFKDWQYWDDDSHLEVAPHIFINWCQEERINSEWLRLFLELLGCSDDVTVDLTAARFALLTGR